MMRHGDLDPFFNLAAPSARNNSIHPRLLTPLSLHLMLNLISVTRAVFGSHLLLQFRRMVGPLAHRCKMHVLHPSRSRARMHVSACSHRDSKDSPVDLVLHWRTTSNRHVDQVNPMRHMRLHHSHPLRSDGLRHHNPNSQEHGHPQRVMHLLVSNFHLLPIIGKMTCRNRCQNY